MIVLVSKIKILWKSFYSIFLAIFFKIFICSLTHLCNNCSEQSYQQFHQTHLLHTSLLYSHILDVYLNALDKAYYEQCSLYGRNGTRCSRLINQTECIEDYIAFKCHKDIFQKKTSIFSLSSKNISHTQTRCMLK